ncbi:MAG: DUF998 domain-containing protein [Planctomycetota bacterium]|nr:DUF998 domain-containing protein [Planctomycetota bacterium]
MSKLSRRAASVCFWSAASFLLLLALLHLLRPDMDPSWRFISEYELGDFGWVMQLAFLALSLSCVTSCVALFSQARTMAGHIGRFTVMLTAFGLMLGGLVVPGEEKGLHDLGATLNHLPFGAPLINWSLSRNPAWKRAKPMLLGTAFLPLAGLVLFFVSLGIMLPRNEGKPGPTVLVGWQNRILVVLECAWLMATAYYASKLGAGVSTTGESTQGKSSD